MVYCFIWDVLGIFDVLASESERKSQGTNGAMRVVPVLWRSYGAAQESVQSSAPNQRLDI